MTEAPINDKLGLERWLKLVQLALSGWRKSVTATLVFDFPLISTFSLSSTTLTLKGVRQGDPASVTPFDPTAGILYQATVTADDTVTIYAHNVSSGSINPASTTFRVIVFQQ